MSLRHGWKHNRLPPFSYKSFFWESYFLNILDHLSRLVRFDSRATIVFPLNIKLLPTHLLFLRGRSSIVKILKLLLKYISGIYYSSVPYRSLLKLNAVRRKTAVQALVLVCVYGRRSINHFARPISQTDLREAGSMD